MRVRSVVAGVVVCLLTVTGCGGPSFEDQARQLHDETRADWLAMTEDLDWGFEITSDWVAAEEAGSFDLSREGSPGATEGGITMRATTPPEKILTVEQLRPLTTALADGGYVLRRSACDDKSVVGAFENADGGALGLGITRNPASIRLDTTLTMDHRLSTVDEVMTGSEDIQPGCWPAP